MKLEDALIIDSFSRGKVIMLKAEGFHQNLYGYVFLQIPQKKIRFKGVFV